MPHAHRRVAPSQLLNLVTCPASPAVVQEDTDATVAKIKFEAAEAAQKDHMDRVNSLLSDDVIASICRPPPATAARATPIDTEIEGVRYFFFWLCSLLAARCIPPSSVSLTDEALPPRLCTWVRLNVTLDAVDFGGCAPKSSSPLQECQDCHRLNGRGLERDETGRPDGCGLQHCSHLRPTAPRP